MNEDQDEQECINRVRNGEHAAYAILVDRYKTFAYSIALKMLANEQDAEDAAQEGFIKAYQQLHQFQGRSKFSTWLYTIIYRIALARIAEKKIKVFSMTEAISKNITSDGPTPQLALMQADDEKRSISDAINTLPKTDALLVMLFYMNENTVTEIKQITGLSVANIKIRLYRSRKKLEKQLRFLVNDNSDLQYGKQPR